jgi:predicted acylesterase/phospholipase RssA
MRSLVSFLTLVGYASALDTEAKTCHAIALSGGGNKGAYEAGVINGLVTNSKPEDVEWKVCSGVSAGAMNCSFLVGFKVGDEKAMTAAHLEFTKNLESSKVY